MLQIRHKTAVDKCICISRILAQCDEFLVIVVDGIRISHLRFEVDPLEVGIQTQPGRSGCKTGLCSGAPLKWCARVVAAVFGDCFQRFLYRSTAVKGHLIRVYGGNVVNLIN